MEKTQLEKIMLTFTACAVSFVIFLMTYQQFYPKLSSAVNTIIGGVVEFFSIPAMILIAAGFVFGIISLFRRRHNLRTILITVLSALAIVFIIIRWDQ